jgi:GTPase SAR1 family protein
LRVEHPPVKPALADQPAALFGNSYFRTREKLNYVIEALGGMAAKSGIALERLDELINLSADLENPFLFAVVGDAGAGKSTLLDALFGGESEKAGFAQASGRIALHKYGSEARESDLSEDIVEVFRPITTLKNFNLLTLPGAKAVGSAYPQVAERFLPDADLIFFVFSVTNPWGEPTWEFLDRIHRQWSRKIVFVLLQCDRRTEEEVAAIREHAQKVARHRFGRHFPTFTVSAKMALLAKIPGHDQAELHHQSGVESLQLHLSAVLESSAPRLVKLIHGCRAARDALEVFKVRLGAVSEIIRTKDETLSKLEFATGIQMEFTLEKHQALLDGLDQSFVAAGIQAENLLNAEFGFTSILLPRRHRPGRIEDLISTITMKAVRDAITSVASINTEDLDKFYLELSNNGVERPNWEAPGRCLSSSIEEATAVALREMNLGEELGALFRRSTRLIWGCLITSMLSGLTGITLTLLHRGLPTDAVDLLVELVAGVVFTMLERDLWNALALFSALVCLVVATAVASRLMRRARAVYSSILNLNRERISKAQRVAFGEQMPSFYRNFNAPLERLRKIFRENRGSHESTLRKIEKMESSLAEVERVLHPLVKVLVSRDYPPQITHRDMNLQGKHEVLKLQEK